MKKTVKIGFFILLGCILLGIGIVIFIFSRQLNYEKLLKAGYKNYEVDITYTADEEDGFSFWGNYICSIKLILKKIMRINISTFYISITHYPT